MKRIICVDDDISLQNVFSMIFERAGYLTTVYADAQAITNNEFELPDLFILDKQLSGTSGLDICRHLKSQDRTKHIPVIIISASPCLAEDAASAGADGYLEKPFKLKTLLDLAQKYTAGLFVES